MSVSTISELSILLKLSNFCTHLRIINLTGCKNLEPGFVGDLRSLKIHCLELGHCEQLDDSTMEMVAYFLPEIRVIDISYLPLVTSLGLQRISRLPNLQHISLKGYHHISYYPFFSKPTIYYPNQRKASYCTTELVLGEQSRSQFRLPSFIRNFNTTILIQTMPLLEVLDLDLVLIDWKKNDLMTLFDGCPNLREISLLLYDEAITNLLNCMKVLTERGSRRPLLTSTKSSCATSRRWNRRKVWCSESMSDDIKEIDMSRKCLPLSERLERLSLSIHGGLDATKLDLIIINSGKSLSRLRFSKEIPVSLITDDFLVRLITFCPNVRLLDFVATNITAKSVQHLKDLENLQSFCARDLMCSNEVLACLSHLKLCEFSLLNFRKPKGCLSLKFKYLFAARRPLGFPNRGIQDVGAQTRLKPSGSPNLAESLLEFDFSTTEFMKDGDLAEGIVNIKNLKCVDFKCAFDYPKTVQALSTLKSLIIVQLTRMPDLIDIGGGGGGGINGPRRASSPTMGAVGGMVGIPLPNNIISQTTGNVVENAANAVLVPPTPTTPNANANAVAGPPTGLVEVITSTLTELFQGPIYPISLYKSLKSTTQTKILASDARSKSIGALSALTKLRFLVCVGPLGLNDSSLKSLATLKSLNTLWIRGNPFITVTGVVAMCRGTKDTLKRLGMNHCSAINRYEFEKSEEAKLIQETFNIEVILH